MVYSCVCVLSAVLLCVKYKMKVCSSRAESLQECMCIRQSISLMCVMSGPALYWLLQTHFTARRHNGESVVHVVADQVTHTFKPMVFCADLQDKDIHIHQTDMFTHTLICTA